MQIWGTMHFHGIDISHPSHSPDLHIFSTLIKAVFQGNPQTTISGLHKNCDMCKKIEAISFENLFEHYE